MQHIDLRLIKSFSKNRSQGNPAAVCFPQRDLSLEEYKNITRQTGCSECAFVKLTEDATEIRFFSPEKEMNMCGHATLAVAHILRDKATKRIFDTKSGKVAVEYQPDGLIEINISSRPRYYTDLLPFDRIAYLLGINLANIASAPVKVSVGTPKVLVELNSDRDLWQLQPQFDSIAKEIPQGVYPFVKMSERLYYARQFNPATGLSEDPVTGIAAAALGAHLNTNFAVEQGHLLNKMGTISVKIDDKGVRIGGYAIEYGSLKVPLMERA